MEFNLVTTLIVDGIAAFGIWRVGRYGRGHLGIGPLDIDLTLSMRIHSSERFRRIFLNDLR